MTKSFTSIMAASLLGTTALISSASAQVANETASGAQACEALQVVNEENAELFNEEFVVGARDVVARANPVECGPWLAEAEESLEANEGADLTATGGRINVIIPDPNVVVDQADPQVSVRQADPNVSVRQAPPEIIVRQQQPTIRVEMPRPVITIDQPQPQIIVRMPDPDVDVSTPQPEVSVSMQEPTVRVDQQQPRIGIAEPTVNVAERDGANVEIQEGQPIVRQDVGTDGANVNIEDAQPVVRYEQAEPIVEFSETQDPEIRYTQTGEPQIQVEEMNGEAATGAVAGDDQYASLRMDEEPVEAGALAAVAVSDVTGRQVVNAEGENLGTVDRLVFADERIYAVIAEGGFLGLGEREVALPLDAMSMRGEELLLRGMTDADIDALPEFDAAAATAYRDDEQVQMNRI